MNLKKYIAFFAVVFFVSFASAAATRYWMSRHPAQVASVNWKELLHLTDDQAKKFSTLESDFNLALKDIEVHDAQNKIFLCSYLSAGLKEPERKSAVRKMVWVYQVKQEKIAATLAAMSAVLTPEQSKIFSQTLMHQVCLACRNSNSTDQCLCGMCDHHS